MILLIIILNIINYIILLDYQQKLIENSTWYDFGVSFSMYSNELWFIFTELNDSLVNMFNIEFLDKIIILLSIQNKAQWSVSYIFKLSLYVW